MSSFKTVRFVLEGGNGRKMRGEVGRERRKGYWKGRLESCFKISVVVSPAVRLPLARRYPISTCNQCVSKLHASTMVQSGSTNCQLTTRSIQVSLGVSEEPASPSSSANSPKCLLPDHALNQTTQDQKRPAPRRKLALRVVWRPSTAKVDVLAILQ